MTSMSYIEPKPPQLPVPSDCRRVPGNFWKPNPAFVTALSEYLRGRKVLEIFAGNGYLAGLLAARGIEVKSTSLLTGHDSHSAGLYHAVEVVDAVNAVRQYREQYDVLLISWPTVTPAALHALTLWGSSKEFVYIGEVTDYTKHQLGGCATDAFFESIDQVHQFTSYSGNMLESAFVGRFKGSSQPEEK